MPTFMTVLQTARWAGITRASVYQAIYQGRLPATDINNGEQPRALYLIDPKDAERLWGNRHRKLTQTA